MEDQPGVPHGLHEGAPRAGGLGKVAGVGLGVHAAGSSRRDRPVWRRKTSSRLGRANVNVWARNPAWSSARMISGTALSPWSTYRRMRPSSALASRTNDWPRTVSRTRSWSPSTPMRHDVARHLALQLVRGALGHDQPVVDDGEAIGERVRLLEVVGGQEDRRPLLAEGPDLVPHACPRLRVEAGGRLVEEQHGRPMDDAEADVEPAAHAARVRPGRAVGGGRQLEDLEHLVRPAHGGRLVHAVEPALEDELATTGLGGIGGSALRHVADPTADLLRLLEKVDAGDGRLPTRRDEEGREHPQRGRLAGAVGSEEAEDLPGSDVEVDAAHRLDACSCAS